MRIISKIMGFCQLILQMSKTINIAIDMSTVFDFNRPISRYI